MKKFMKLAAMAMTLAMVLGLSFPSLKAQAAATTWYVTYDSGKNDYFFTDAPATNNWAGASTLDRYINDGDIVIISGDGCGSGKQYTLNISKTIGELAISNYANVIVNAPRVNKVYSVVNSVGVVNAAYVDNAAAYSGSALQINGNVGNFTADYSGEGSGVHPAFGCSGTVDVAVAKYEKSLLAPGTFYSVAKGKFVSNDDGVCKVESGEYSLTPGASSAPAATPATAPAAPASGKVLDSVPKTGATQLSECLIFFMLATVFAIGAFAARKKAN